MVVLVSIFPTIQNRGGSTAAGRTSVSSGSQTKDTVAPVAQATASGGPSSGGAVAGGRPAAVATAAPSRLAQQSAAIAHNQSGVTRGGVACKPGVRQLTFSEYAPPCVAAF